jgi:uncharacterized membrane protein YeaQ/YmgE (transglycosylase-associated protein family)
MAGVPRFDPGKGMALAIATSDQLLPGQPAGDSTNQKKDDETLERHLMRGGGFGLIGDIIVGIIGALIGGWLFGVLGIAAGGFIGAIICATVGAIILIALLRVIKRA